MQPTDFYVSQVLRLNPGLKLYWDGSKYVMEVPRGRTCNLYPRDFHYRIYRDDLLNAFYYRNGDNCAVYLIYIEYVD